MKKLYTLFVLAFFLFLHVQGQVTGDFRSKAVGTGNWNDFNAWETYNGTAWVAATTGQLPTAASAVNVQAGHTIAINAAGLVSGALTVNGTLINDATPTSGVVVNGALSVPLGGKLWLTNTGTTINCPVNGGIAGILQIDAGTVTFGPATLSSQQTNISGTLFLNGANATLNINGALNFYVGSTFTMTNGNINIDPQGLSGYYPFFYFFGVSTVSATGGTITFVNPCTSPNYYSGRAGIKVGNGFGEGANFNFTGSTFRFGNGVSTTAGMAGYGFTVDMQGAVLGNVIVNNPTTYTSNDRIVRIYSPLKIGGNLTINAGTGNSFQMDGWGSYSQFAFPLTLGGNLVNNGKLDASMGGVFTLNGTASQTISGTGTFVIRSLSLSGSSLSTPVVDQQVNMTVSDNLTLTSGSMGSTNASTLTLGNSAIVATMAIIRAGGSLSVPVAFAPTGVTFNVTYNAPFTASVITTGNELPSVVNGTLKINNYYYNTIKSGVILNKPVSCGILDLTAGSLTSSSTNGITITGTTPASLLNGSTTSYVNGPLTRTLPFGLVAANFKFPVGKTTYHLFEYENITTAGTGNATFTVEAFDAGPYTGTAGYGLSTINTDKYWTLKGTLGAVTISSSKIRITDVGFVATSKIGQSNTINGAFNSNGGILGTGMLSSGKALDYSALATGTNFRTGLQGAGIAPGTYAIGPNGPYAGYLGTYATTQMAVNAVSDIVLSGNVIFEYQPDYLPAVEALPINLTQTIVGSPTATVTFRPAAGVTALINLTNAGTALNMTGCGYVIFDGRPGGIGTNKFLQFNNTVATTPTVTLTADANNNQFLYCILKGLNTTAASGIVAISAPVLGNNNNTFSYCNFDGTSSASNCLYATGIASGSNITFNNFFDYRNGSGVWLANGDNAIIDNNSFYQTTTYNGFAGTTYGVNVTTALNCRISNNNIGGSGPLLAGIWTVSATTPLVYNFTGINAPTLTTTSKIYGNKIQNFDWKANSSGQTWTGVNASGSVNIGTDGANLIGSNTGNDNIKVTYFANGAAQITGIIAGGVLARVENNNIGSITTLLNTGITGAGASITGINASGTNTVVNNNIIGSTTTTNSINAANETTIGSTQNIYGIYSTSTASTVTGNTVANINNGITFASGGSIKGIYLPNYASTAIVSANSIYSLSTPQPNITSGNGAVIIGIQSEATNATSLSITGNTIYDLVNTAASAAVTIDGIFYSANANNTIGNNKVDKNYIHSFSTASNTAIQNGIFVSYGIGVFQNNVIRLGIDKSGVSNTSTAQINGINKATSSVCNFYFNTIYVGGTGVVAGTAKTYAFALSAKGNGLEDVRNNIFVNLRANAVANKLNYAISLPVVTAGTWLCDYNIYNVSTTDGILANVATVDQSNLGALQGTCSGVDMHSGFGDPVLTSPATAIATLSLIPGSLTPAEGTGIGITGITDDFTGALRSSNTPTDIGAYSGNFTVATSLQNIFPPAIALNLLANGSSTANRLTANFATITGLFGLNTTVGSKPRIYYKLSTNTNAFGANTAVFNGWKWVEATGTTSPFNFNIDYTLLFGGPVVQGSVIQYFVVAQDLASVPNVSFKPSAGASGANVTTTGMTAPTTPYSYTVVPSIPAAINVGTGQAYTTLTGAGGLFAAINSGSISANTVATIKSDIVEPGTNSLNLVNEEGPNAGALTFTIQSDGVSHVISGTIVAASAPMISVNGAVRLTIDGGTGKFLTFRNSNVTATNTGPVIQYNNNSQNDILTNCYVESNSATAANGVVTVGTTGINNVTISNCDIRDSRGDATSTPVSGIYSNSVGNTLIITNNNIYNFNNTTASTAYGINLNLVANGCTISGNSIYMENGLYPICPITGIYINNSNSHVISGNYIGGSAPLCSGNPFTIPGAVTFNGISVTNSTAPGSTIQGNTIQNISMTNTGTSTIFYGIFNNFGLLTVTGNIIGSATTLNSIQIAGTGVSGGIYQSPATPFPCTFDLNIIANITLTNATGSPTFHGMKMLGGTVRKNSIFNIGSSYNITPIIYGINNSIGLSTTNEFSNNSITLNGGVATNPTLYGFYEGSTNGTTGFYYNSINLYGTASGATASYAFNRATAGIYVFNNNILVNSRTGGTGIHYAIYSTPITLFTSNYNDYYVTGTTLGYWGGVAQTSLATWKAATVQDANSLSINPLFTSATNLTALNNALVSGTPIVGITNDIAGIIRNVTTPTMGAFEIGAKSLSVKVFMEGPFNGTTAMNTTLNTKNILPLTQPYNVAPWNYAGTEIVTAIPAGVVDWVLVELRDAATPATALAATKLAGWPKACFLKSDGTIVDINGANPLIGYPTVVNNLYVVIRHRNHVAIMSAAGLTQTGNSFGYDFTTAVTQAYGGATGYKQIATGLFGMVSGDVDGDGSITTNDFTIWATNFGKTGVCLSSDIDGDGNITTNDYTKWALNFGVSNIAPLKSLNVQGAGVKYTSQVPDNK